MKKNSLTMLIMPLFLAAAISCGNIIPTEKDIDYNIDDVKFDDEEKPSEDDETNICSIYELNRSGMAENSHSNSWKYSSLEMDYRSYVELGASKLSTYYPFYPRVKKMKNGQYLLLYQHNTNANDCYYAISDDMKTWTDKGYLFQRESNSVKYKNPDAVVLENGDILVFVCKQGKWIEMRRSTDNAQTWGEKQIIYTGGSMEPSALQLKSGEIQVYYTKCNTSRGYSQGYGDSGTGLLRSFDNGNNWVDEEGKIIRQKTGVWPVEEGGDGLPIYTDQMSVGIELTGNRGIAVASESRHKADYFLTMSWCDNNWTEPRDLDKVPADRLDNWTSGTGPYLRQFPSGESLLSYRAHSLFTVRLGNSIAREFDSSEPYCPFTRGGGGWGSIEVIDSHIMAGAFPAKYERDGEDATDLMLAKFILNHQIWATSMTPAIDGNHKDWSDVQEALFIGSASNAQTCFRFAYSEDYLYVLVERLDENVSESDVTNISIMASDFTGTPYKITLTPNGNTVKCDQAVVTCGSFVSNINDGKTRSGYLCELAIPRMLLGEHLDKLLFNATTAENGVVDGFTGLTDTNYDKWIPIMLKEYVQPKPEPKPGEDDTTGNGPSWSTSEDTVNPW